MVSCSTRTHAEWRRHTLLSQTLYREGDQDNNASLPVFFAVVGCVYVFRALAITVMGPLAAGTAGLALNLTTHDSQVMHAMQQYVDRDVLLTR